MRRIRSTLPVLAPIAILSQLLMLALVALLVCAPSPSSSAVERCPHHATDEGTTCPMHQKQGTGSTDAPSLNCPTPTFSIAIFGGAAGFVADTFRLVTLPSSVPLWPGSSPDVIDGWPVPLSPPPRVL